MKSRVGLNTACSVADDIIVANLGWGLCDSSHVVGVSSAPAVNFLFLFIFDV